MSDNEPNLLSLEEELTSVEEDTLQEERKNVKHNFDLLDKEYRSIKVPYPDVHPYDVGMDYNDISDIQYKKGRNQKAWEKRGQIEKYLNCRELFIGHFALTTGPDYYIMDFPLLESRFSVSGEPIHFINTDDQKYTNLIRLWRYPAESESVQLSRNIQMHDRTVDDVDIILDRSNRDYSNINDLFLRKALIRNKNNGRIESIIQTIQKKQDDIRLLPKNKSFIVQGCAGSGKTMVLLHRLRYLIFNKEIDSDEFLFLIPNRKFGRFVKDICSQFLIPSENVVPIQHYYKKLSGDKTPDEGDEVSELVYSPEYLERVYSRKFMQDACRQLVETINEQLNILVEIGDSALTQMLKNSEEELQKNIQQEQTDAVSLARDAVERISGYIKTKIENYPDVEKAEQEIQDAYDAAEANYENLLNFDEKALPETEKILEQDKTLQRLREEMKSAEERVKHASIFTAAAHRKKLDAVKVQYEERRTLVLQDYTQEEKKKREEKAITAMFVYEDVALEEAKTILDEITYIEQDSRQKINQLKEKLKHIQDEITEKHADEIALLNDMITASVSFADERQAKIYSLEPDIDAILDYLSKGSKLYNAVYALSSSKERKRIENHCKLFRGRSNRDQANYLNQVLFSVCRQLIRSEFDIKISKVYKHYWYLTLYCQYLTKGIFSEAKKYLYIDEAQDLSSSEIELIFKINAAHNSSGYLQSPAIELFGDVNQMITRHGISSWDKISFIHDVYTLNENFRNTNQIIDFCNRRFSFEMKKVGVDLDGVEEYPTLNLVNWKTMPIIKSSVFIVKGDYELKDLHVLLTANRIVEYEAYTVKQAKGLEFKTVCVFDEGMTEAEKYIAYTRALSKLIVIHKLPRIELNHVSMIVAGDEPDLNEENDSIL